MRRVVGAYLLIAVLAIPSAREYLRSPHPGLQDTLLLSSPDDTIPAAPAGPRPSISVSVSPIPQDYIEHPLAFLSRAPSDSLQLLSGIGPVLAERIASARSDRSLFTRWDDLLSVKGIGPKKLERLREQAKPAD